MPTDNDDCEGCCFIRNFVNFLYTKCLCAGVILIMCWIVFDHIAFLYTGRLALALGGVFAFIAGIYAIGARCRKPPQVIPATHSTANVVAVETLRAPTLAPTPERWAQPRHLAVPMNGF